MTDIEELNLPCCTMCGQRLEWVDCDQCGGEGYFDTDDFDVYHPGDRDQGRSERCTECHGCGGWWECANAELHIYEAQELEASE